jgi:hypothetical protein
VLAWRDTTGGVLVLVDERHIDPDEGSHVGVVVLVLIDELRESLGKPCDRADA